MRKREKEREEDEEFEQEKLPYSFFQQKLVSRQLHYYLSGPLEEPSNYTEMIHQIRMATSNDTVHLHLNTPGGFISTGVQIISAMRSSQGHIVTHLEGEACSLGALLFLASDEMVVYDDSILMFHNYSAGAIGKGHELTASVDASNRWYTKLITTICSPFLTDDELNAIFAGADFWMLSDEVEQRLKRMAKKSTPRVTKSKKKAKKKTKKKVTKKKAKKKVKA